MLPLLLLLTAGVTSQSSSSVAPSSSPSTNAVPTVSCTLNETFRECSGCENVCESSCQDCSNQCGPPRCECIDGFYRNSTGFCVIGHDCGGAAPSEASVDASLESGAMSCEELRCPETFACVHVVEANCTNHTCAPTPICVPQVPIVYANSSNASCPVNETFFECSSTCEDSCLFAEQNCSNICGAPACQCSSGFYRNASGNCVQGHDCDASIAVTGEPNTEPIIKGCELIACLNETVCQIIDGKATCTVAQNDTCGMNEAWTTCASNCEPSCSTPSPVCAAVCAPAACQCQQTFLRSANGTCVVQDECDSSSITCEDENEELKNCPSTCEPSCAQPNLLCQDDCLSPNQTCQCKPLFVRDANGKCVSLDQCTTTVPVSSGPTGMSGSSTILTTLLANMTTTTTMMMTTTMHSSSTTTTANLCGKHERITQCKHGCEETCRGIPTCDSKVSNSSCSVGCVCQSGYTRGHDNICVKISKCSKNPGCLEHEKWSECIASEPKCAGVTNITISNPLGVLCLNGCGCIDGFYRSTSGNCVAEC